jgi:hypothetical protein
MTKHHTTALLRAPLSSPKGSYPYLQIKKVRIRLQRRGGVVPSRLRTTIGLCVWDIRQNGRHFLLRSSVRPSVLLTGQQVCQLINFFFFLFVKVTRPPPFCSEEEFYFYFLALAPLI